MKRRDHRLKQAVQLIWVAEETPRSKQSVQLMYIFLVILLLCNQFNWYQNMLWFSCLIRTAIEGSSKKCFFSGTGHCVTKIETNPNVVDSWQRAPLVWFLFTFKIRSSTLIFDFVKTELLVKNNLFYQYFTYEDEL